VEAGIVLLVMPWTQYWDHNYFVRASRVLEPTLASPWLRGAISGVGLVTLFAGLADLVALFLRRSQVESTSTP
jgi:hypothetical protein